MVYEKGNPVLSTDYQNLVDKINGVFGTGGVNPDTSVPDGSYGYGGNSVNVALSNLETSKPTGVPITSNDWKNLLGAYTDCADHQGMPLPDTLTSISNLDPGEEITAGTGTPGLVGDPKYFQNFDSSSHPANINQLISNHLVFSGSSFTTTTPLTSVRTTPWSSNLNHEFTVTFATVDAARYFFNTGGQIRISATRTGTSSPQNDAWTNLVNANSPVILGHGITPSTPLATKGYYDLDTNYSTVELLNVSATAPYTANQWTVRAKRVDLSPFANGGNGRIIQIRSQFIDGYAGGGDSVDGTFTSIIEQRISTTFFNNIASPVYAVITDFTGGA